MRAAIRKFAAIADVPAAMRGGAVAIGNFDGVHRGHRTVLDQTLDLAQPAGGPAMVLTFEPHPRTFFSPQKAVFRLTPAPLKRKLLKEAGLDAVIEQEFDSAFSQITADAFVEDLLAGSLGVGHVVVGENFHFGRGRQGTPQYLVERGEALGFGVTIVPPRHDAGGDIISSTRIRDALARGDIGLANELLGWRWRVEGQVQHGRKLGRTLGFPTANVALPPETALKPGIYAVRAETGYGTFDGVASFGRRPTFDDGELLLETFLFDFNQDLYGQDIGIEFAGHIRDEERFEQIDDLVAQMHADAGEARRILAAGRQSAGLGI